MHTRYYIEFKIWAEGYVDIPWHWAKFEELPDYRLRTDFMVAASPTKVKSIFLGMNDNVCTKFLKDYVPALVMGVILDLPDATDAASTLKTVFGYSEILGICEITDANRNNIQEVMANARAIPTVAITP